MLEAKRFICIVISLIGTLILRPVAIADPQNNLLPNCGFEAALNGWEQSGKVVIYPDELEKHQGKYAARIPVDTATTANYQSVSQSLPVLPGADYSVSVWSRCKMIDGTGAYAALEFVRDGQRISIEHTPMLQQDKWTQLHLQATAPPNATSMRLLLVFHAHGDAWFDDAEVVRLQPHTSQARLQLDQSAIITDNWQGFGVTGDLFLLSPGMTDSDRKLVRDRIMYMRPQIARVCFSVMNWESEYGKPTPDSPGMQEYRKALEIFEEAGTDIILHEWGYNLPQWCKANDRSPDPAQRRSFTDSIAAVVKHIREDWGISHLRYVAIYNEPNWGGVPWEDYVQVYKSLDESLKSAGLRGTVHIVGPDEANENKWLPKAVNDLDSVIDDYAVHNYTCDFGSQYAGYVTARAGILPATAGDEAPRRKRLLVTEFGMCDGMSTWSNPHIDEYEYGLFLADSAISSANAGASAMIPWCLMDIDGFGQPLKWGLWKSRQENWEPRPGFYSWSLITRYTERGSTVHKIISDTAGVEAVAFRGPRNGAWTLLAVNRDTDSLPVHMSSLPSKSKWQLYVYSRETIPEKRIISSKETKQANSKGDMDMMLPPQSFVLLRQVL